MISCPKCNQPIDLQKNHYCAFCKLQIDIMDKTFILNPEVDGKIENYDPKILSAFKKIGAKHFWFRIRKEIIVENFLKLVHFGASVLEIGAGTGYISSELGKQGYEVSVGDIHSQALSLIDDEKIKNKYQFDLTKSPFKNHFEAVGAFDVLEHIPDDKLALQKIYQMLKPKGKIFITVPAHHWLWSQFDYTHQRRYELKDLKKNIEEKNFRVIIAKNFFVLIVPLLLLRAFLYKTRKESKNKKIDKIFAEQFTISNFFNAILYQILRFENYLIRNVSPKIGGSILIVAEKL